MQYKHLGQTGLRVSTVGLGCMNFGSMNDENESAAIVARALELGINFFDTADVYGDRGKSEEYLGRALAHRRPDVIIATKFAGPMAAGETDLQGGSRRYIMRAVEASLQRLGTDYIDLYQMHRYDPGTPIEETLRALDDLIHQGKIRYIGSSNFAAWQIADAHWTARQQRLHHFVSAQNRYSLLTREIEKEVVPACARYGLGILPYFPLESGLLTGKYRKGQPFPKGSRLYKWQRFASGAFASPDKVDQAEALRELASERGCTLLDLAMGWLASRPQVANVIAGVTSIEQLEQNVAAAEWRPTTEDEAAIDEITAPEEPRYGPARR